MGRAFRVTSVVVALFVLHLYTVPCFAAGDVGLPKEMKVTTNDPQFLPLSDEQEIKKGGRNWIWYVLGAAAVVGLAAAAGGGGGGGGGGGSTSSTGNAIVSWQ